MSVRGDKNTILRRKTVIYSDFLNNFDRNPYTGYLGIVTNEDAIAQEIRNLCLTNRGERFYNFELGSDIPASLFEPFDTGDIEALKIRLFAYLAANVKNAKIISVEIPDDGQSLDTNSLAIEITYSGINTIDHVRTITIHLKRVR